MTRDQLMGHYDTHQSKIKLFLTGFAQVIFVAGNTVFISESELLPNFITGFMISLIWTYNVKKIAFGSNGDRFAYATGAAIGSVAGSIIAHAMVG
jgi:hypothetical protein